MKDPKEITDALMAPFPVDVIDEKQGLLYVPAEIVRLRLIDATDNQFDWHLDRTEFRLDGASTRTDRGSQERVEVPVAVAYGHLTIPGLGTRAGVGVQEIQPSGGADSAYKGAESDALKRAAMQFGVGLHQLYIEPGEAKRDKKSGNRRQTQQQPARATTSPKPARQQAPKLTPDEINDKEFDDLVRAALATKDGGEYIRLVEAYAGKYTSRWIVLVRNCESEQGLDWIARKAEQMGIESAGLPIAIANRRAELTGALEGTHG